MPELPEVETTRRGIEPYLLGQRIKQIVVRQPQLRWPVPRNLNALLKNKVINLVTRRGKYLLMGVQGGTVLIHLGMSGRLHILSDQVEPQKHDHVDILLNNGQILRYTDPRRFGSILWSKGDPLKHKLLVNLGPEPLGDNFNGAYLCERACQRKVPIKNFIMNSAIVVGVGNIYANEALFLSGISPSRQAGQISLNEYKTLVENIRGVLAKAIAAGGTTLRDFLSVEGKAGYFSQELLVYGRGGEPCSCCQQPLKEIRLGQRSTVFCQKCQS